MPTHDIDARRMIDTLNRHEVEYVVIGGFAIELWDVAVPPTQDVDVTPAMTVSNLQRLCDALNELHPAIRLSRSAPIPVPGGLTPALFTQMTVLNLATDVGPLDVTVSPAGVGGYDELAEGAFDLEYQGVPVPTAALEDVLRSKEAAGREKDLKTIPAIRAHLEMRRRQTK